MGKRMNDTSAIAAMPVCGSAEYSSKNVRKIDNGYLTSCHQSGPAGFMSYETYSKEFPTDSPKSSGELDSNPSAMKRAVDFMKKV